MDEYNNYYSQHMDDIDFEPTEEDEEDGEEDVHDDDGSREW